MTANAMLGDKEKVMDAGMNDHIAKPINVQNMFNTMANWIVPSNPDRVIESDIIETYAEGEFPVLPGIDTSRGLATCQGNQKLYRKLLSKFQDSMRDFKEQFQLAQDSKDSEAPARCVHSLKGVAGNIGATELYKAAQDLELACKQEQAEEHIKQLLQVVSTSLSELLDSLKTLELTDLSTETEQDEQLDTEKLKTLLLQLRELLEDDDADAADVVEEIEALPGISSHKLVLKRLLKAIDEYDFELALEELDSIDLKSVNNQS